MPRSAAAWYNTRYAETEPEEDTPVSAAEELGRIAAEVRGCRACKLYQTATRGVPGEGPADAKIMFIGEAPGFNEDRQGRPFVGAAGQFLEELLAIAGLRRQDVFIANVVKHRPPNNRDPEPDEIAACAPFLERQIAAINPLVIVTLGRFSMARWFPGERISRIHGQPRWIGGRMIIPMMHPAAALHQPQNRPLIENDFRRLPEFLAEAERRMAQAAQSTAVPEKPDEPEMEQLPLF
nr:MAG: uracil-DNA glycosylase [Chloroflexota bacterium]